MHTITKISQINCSIEELFEFHMDSNNIKKITPSNIKVKLLSDNSKTYEGKIVKLKTTKFFLTTPWEVKIEKIQKPNLLVDIALKSPFKYWEHHHIFIEKNGFCELKDEIKFEMPFGFIGNLFSAFIILDIKNMFDFRHKKTKEILEKV